MMLIPLVLIQIKRRLFVVIVIVIIKVNKYAVVVVIIGMCMELLKQIFRLLISRFSVVLDIKRVFELPLSKVFVGGEVELVAGLVE